MLAQPFAQKSFSHVFPPSIFLLPADSRPSPSTQCASFPAAGTPAISASKICNQNNIFYPFFQVNDIFGTLFCRICTQKNGKEAKRLFLHWGACSGAGIGFQTTRRILLAKKCGRRCRAARARFVPYGSLLYVLAKLHQDRRDLFAGRTSLRLKISLAAIARAGDQAKPDRIRHGVFCPVGHAARIRDDAENAFFSSVSASLV